MPDVEAHITGTVWKIECQVGDTIEEGDTVVILESMKMEMPVEAEDAGTVSEVLCEEGQAVNEGDPLVAAGLPVAGASAAVVGRRLAPAPARHGRLERRSRPGLGVGQREPRAPLDVGGEGRAELGVARAGRPRRRRRG